MQGIDQFRVQARKPPTISWPSIDDDHPRSKCSTNTECICSVLYCEEHKASIKPGVKSLYVKLLLCFIISSLTIHIHNLIF